MYTIGYTYLCIHEENRITLIVGLIVLYFLYLLLKTLTWVTLLLFVVENYYCENPLEHNAVTNTVSCTVAPYLLRRDNFCKTVCVLFLLLK